MAKKKFKLRAKLIFRGEFQIMAHSKSEAAQKLKDNVECISKIQSQDTEDIAWNFQEHGQVILNSETEKEEDSEQ